MLQCYMYVSCVIYTESVGGPTPTPPTSRGSDNGDPFVTLAGPETTCVRGVFWEGGDSLGKTWGRTGERCSLCVWKKPTVITYVPVFQS